ncbi:MAG: hypothetical protein EVA40_03145, partial [Flavobacteriales bacterium]
MKGVFISGLQGMYTKLIILLTFLIYPSLNFSQVYQIKNEEVTTRVILDKEYIVLSKFESESGNFISTLGGYYKPREFLNLNEDV